MNITLTITEHIAKNGTHYSITYLKGKFYFVHIRQEKLAFLKKSTTKRGKPCEIYTGAITVDDVNNIIFI